MRGRGTSCLVRDSAPEFENSRECWRLHSDHDRELPQKKKERNNKITESGFLFEIVRSLDKPLEDNGLGDRTRR